ncbi:MAG: triose-phosphate isomerase [Kiritimatiellia bacterium]|jgi:triosephosphate isomerase
MLADYRIRAPFFEFGPKAYLYGERLLDLVMAIDDCAIEHDVDVIVDPQPTDIRLLARHVKRVHVYGQHADCLPPGRGMGSILPEALKAAGAVGVMLNHAERKLSLDVIEKTIRRADEAGLATIVCADTITEMEAVARLAPNLIVAEPTDLIGTGRTSSMDYVLESIARVKAINPAIMVLQGAGISNGEDVYNVIRAGAEATGSTSGILKAPDPAAMAREMIAAVRRAWDERQAAAK